MQKNTKGIKAFLQDSKAISPAIATLILIVIAAVAAAGIGIIVQNAQQNTQGQVGQQHLDVSGTISIKGSTTLIPIEQNEISSFSKLYPSVTITMGGGGSGTGRALVFSKQVDIGASSDQWGASSTDSTTGVTYWSRNDAVIQASGKDAFIYETPIGKGMIVVAGNLQDGTGTKNTVTAINIVPGYNSSYTVDSTNKKYTLNISFADLKYGYAASDGKIPKANLSSANANFTGTDFGNDIQTVTRSDDGGTSEVFNQWLNSAASGQMDGTNGNVKTYAVGEQGNQGIRDYINGQTNSIGYIDIGFANGGANNAGKTLVLAATMNGTVASKTTLGLGGAYDTANKQVSPNRVKSLNRDLYFYSQGVPTGAVKAFLDYVTSPEGQTIVESSGFYKN